MEALAMITAIVVALVVLDLAALRWSADTRWSDRDGSRWAIR
jgi:nitrogen fixation-related uncharacterized protein